MTTLTNAYREHLDASLSELVGRLQTEVKTDALDLYQYALAQRRKELEQVDWDEEFQRAEIKLNVVVNITDFGRGL